LCFLEASNYWKEVALDRLMDQLETLIVIEKGIGVLTENSTAYHNAMINIVEFVLELVKLTDDKYYVNKFEEILTSIKKFTKLINYPDGRAPFIGDSFRRKNDKIYKKRVLNKMIEKNFISLKKAGYAIVNGIDEKISYKFIMVASNLNKTHKHEDHLSFILYYDGLEWFVDPSFYSHDYSESFPKYLRSVEAHNNLVIKDFIYSNDLNIAKIDSSLEKENFTITGEHRAYKDILIKRIVKGNLNRLFFEFEDSYMSENKHKAYVMFHLGESVIPEIIDERKILLKSDLSNKTLSINFESEVKIEKFYGNDIGYGFTGLGFKEREEIYSIKILLPDRKINYIIKKENENSLSI